jgi:hypothetical protein
VAQLGPEAAALVGRWSLEEHKLSCQGVRDTADRLRSASSAITREDGPTNHERGG